MGTNLDWKLLGKIDIEIYIVIYIKKKTGIFTRWFEQLYLETINNSRMIGVDFIG